MKTKILIVDDSRIFRGAIEECLAGEPDIEIVGSVWNGVKAMEFIREKRPDLVTLDLEMPEMDGLETLSAIQKINSADKDIYPIGVIILSSLTRQGADVTVRALEMGAFDFITKPEGENRAENIDTLRRKLIVKIRYFASKRISSYLLRNTHIKMGRRGISREISVPFRALSKSGKNDISAVPTKRHLRDNTSNVAGIKAIMIGVSTGGPKALGEMLPILCERICIPIFIVQHMPPTFTQSLANSLNNKCRYTVIEAQDGDPVENEHVYIAPGGKHMLLRKKNSDVVIGVNNHPPEKGCRPSVDVLFRSAAAVYGKETIGIVLTGMGEDGTKGCGILKRSGAQVIVQDKKTSVVWGMPGSVEASGNVDRVLPLYRIPDAVVNIMTQTIEE